MTTCPRCHLSWGRSDEEHNTLFGVIGLAFDNWPETHGFQPATPEHLRAWLAIRANHVIVRRVTRVRGMNRDVLREIAVAFTDEAIYYEVSATKTHIDITLPRTMKKADLKVQEFRRMATAVYEIIELATGITPEIYKQEKDNRNVSRPQGAGQFPGTHAKKAQEQRGVQAAAGHECGSSGVRA